MDLREPKLHSHKNILFRI